MREPTSSCVAPSRGVEITSLLGRWHEGEPDALAELLPVVYGELRRLARRALGSERADHTLEATALVHEAYLRLSAGHPAACRDRLHFFALAARLMRHILVDHARRRRAVRRGLGGIHLGLEDAGELASGGSGDALAAMVNMVDLVDLDRALQRLAELDPRKARVIELRFFAGLSVEETAELLGVSTPTVILDTRLAKAFLYDGLSTEGRRGR